MQLVTGARSLCCIHRCVLRCPLPPLQTYELMVELLEREVPQPPPAAASEAPADGAAPASAQGEAQLSGFGGEQGTLLWMQYVRFLRRTTGAPSSRQVHGAVVTEGGGGRGAHLE